MKNLLRKQPQDRKLNRLTAYRLPLIALAKLTKYWHDGFLHKAIVILVGLIIFISTSLYSAAQWYTARHADEPITIGATFISGYAEHFGLNPRETMAAVIDDLDIKHLRLVSYWNEGEPRPGLLDFSDLDWQFRMAEAKGAKVSLAIGLRQPRWPECHMPQWAAELPKELWIPELMEYIEAVVMRYKDSPALDSWQLENEFFLSIFTKCADNSKQRLIDEFNLVRSLDPDHKIIMSVSGDWGIAYRDDPQPDIYGMALYKRVYEPKIFKRYIEYPFPSWLYSGRAGVMELLHGKHSIIHEMQAEPWPQNPPLKDVPIDEQYLSMSPERFSDRMSFAVKTGMKHFDLWGVEWWYWLKTKNNSPEMWETGKSEINTVRSLGNENIR